MYVQISVSDQAAGCCRRAKPTCNGCATRLFLVTAPMASMPLRRRFPRLPGFGRACGKFIQVYGLSALVKSSDSMKSWHRSEQAAWARSTVRAIRSSGATSRSRLMVKVLVCLVTGEVTPSACPCPHDREVHIILPSGLLIPNSQFTEQQRTLQSASLKLIRYFGNAGLGTRLLLRLAHRSPA